MLLKNMFGKNLKASLLVFTLLIGATYLLSTLPGEDNAFNKKESELLMQVSVLADSLQYTEARELLEERFQLIKNNASVLSSYGYMSFHIFCDYDKAATLFRRAIQLDPDDPQLRIGMGDTLSAEGNHKDAIICYEQAIEIASAKAVLPLDAELAICYARYGKALLEIGRQKDATTALEGSAVYNPFNSEVNALLHRIYVESEQYSKAYEVWVRAHRVDQAGASERLLQARMRYAQAADALANVSHLDMAHLYDELSLYAEAAVEYKRALAQDQAGAAAEDRLSEIQIFQTFCRELKALLNDYYRDRCTIGPSVETSFYKRIQPAYKEIAARYSQLNTVGGSAFSTGMINREIEKHFGVKIQILLSGGNCQGLHMGRIADQYLVHEALWGKEAELTLTTLSDMISNGLDSWRNFGRGGVGGWSSGLSEIVRVITEDESSDILHLASLYDIQKETAYREQFQAQPGAGMSNDPLALFFDPAIKAELVMKQIEIETEHAISVGIPEESLQDYLFHQIESRFYQKTSIHIHESQHALDATVEAPVQWAGGVEYRPKVAQLAYGEMPFFSLNQFYNVSFGQVTSDPHQRANHLIMEDIVRHIHDAPDSFPAIDCSLNILSQLHLLRAEDLRSIAVEIFRKHYPGERF